MRRLRLATVIAGAPVAVFASTTPMKVDVAFERAALHDLHRVRGDLRGAHPHLTTARGWAERAETELLGRTSFDSHGAMTSGTAVVPIAGIQGAINLRSDIARHDVKQARHDARTAIRQVRSESHAP
jgi:hypothetical protein